MTLVQNKDGVATQSNQLYSSITYPVISHGMTGKSSGRGT